MKRLKIKLQRINTWEGARDARPMTTMRRIADWPIWLRLTGAIWLCLVVAWGSMIAWETRVSQDIAINQAKDTAHSINEMTLAGLTGMMITGTVAQRNVFLDQIKELSAVRDLRVVRGPAVVKQFGPGAGAEAQPHDALERRALAEGKPVIEIETSPDIGEHLRVIYPALASKQYLGKNCLACHMVPEKTPLGLVSMRISLQKTYESVASFRNQCILFAVLISLPLFLMVFLFIRRVVTRPLLSMQHRLETIAKGAGDLTQRLNDHHADEIGQTARRFNQMLGTIADLVRQVGASAEAVNTSAHTLAGQASSLSAGSHQQTSQSNEAASAVVELAGHISEIAEQAELVNARAEENLARSDAGLKTLSDLQKDLTQVEQAVRVMADAESELMASASAITDMTRQVREIADQTNLLALNASIEAARAGEHGRGFAVVADEVRKLAEKSAVSAQQIDTVTQALSHRSEMVRQTVMTSLDFLSSSHQSAERVSSVLDSANASASEVCDGLKQIVSVTVQQQQISSAAAINIDSIAARARENDALIRQTVDATAQLEQLADRLRELVARFHT